MVLRLGAENNDRADPGVSPSRIRFQADYRYQPSNGWGFEAGLGFRASNYDALEVARNEDLTTISAALKRRQRPGILLRTQPRYPRRAANLLITLL
jgi:hypothetical protein